LKSAPHWIANLTKFTCLLTLAAAIVLSLQTSGAVRAQPSVDALIAQIFGTHDAAPYELQAHFRGAFSLTTNASSTEGTAAGLFREWRMPCEFRRWKVTVQEITLPWLLRPFSGAVRTAIEEKAEAQTEALENFRNYDVFLSEEQAGGRYALAGLRRDVVDEAITRYGKSADKQDEATRRTIAQWLVTSPSMQGWAKRPGPLPYALNVMADESGLIQEVQLFYERSQVGMKFSYIQVGELRAWKEVLSTFASSNAKGLGHLEGQLRLGFANYKLDRSPQGQLQDGSDRRMDHDNDSGSEPQP
jgi:hypothetical protein